MKTRKQFVLTALIACLIYGNVQAEGKTMPNPNNEFTCVHEAMNSPVLTEKGVALFLEARRQETKRGRKDPALIQSLYTQSIEEGNWKAMYNVAMKLRKEGKSKQALEILAPMVENNIPIGIYGMAVMLKEGGGVKRDPALASQYMHRAAELGSPLAQLYLGGQAIGRYDMKLGKQYYYCAASQGNKEAAYQLAMDIRSSEENYPKAAQMYLLAASLGHQTAFSSLRGFFSGHENTLISGGFDADPELDACLAKRLYQLDADKTLTFPNLAKECPIPLHPVMGDGSEYPELEMRIPGFLERLKTTGHDPEFERIRGEKRIQWLRESKGLSEVKEKPAPVLRTIPLEGLDQWTMEQVQSGEYFVKRDRTWIYVKDGAEVPSRISGYLESVLNTHYVNVLEVEAFHEETDGQFKTMLRTMLG